MDKRICPVCGKELAQNAHQHQKYCSSHCKIKATNTKAKERREFRKKNNLCVVCGKEPPIKGGLLCWRCSANNKDWCKEKYEKRKERHICHQCGKPLADGRVVCSECIAKRNEKSKQLYKLRKLNNQCVKCGKKHQKGYSHSLCQMCLDKMANSKEKAA